MTCSSIFTESRSTVHAAGSRKLYGRHIAVESLAEGNIFYLVQNYRVEPSVYSFLMFTDLFVFFYTREHFSQKFC